MITISLLVALLTYDQYLMITIIPTLILIVKSLNIDLKVL
jgi:hypothetical protein